MADIIKVPVEIQEPATLSVGGAHATDLREIIAGVVSVDLPSINAAAIGSASAAVTGLTANHRVLISPVEAAITDAPAHIVAAVGIAGGFQVTAYNSSGAAVNATARNVNYFAFR